MMPSQARAEFDPMMMGVRIAVIHGGPGDQMREIIQWPTPIIHRYDAASGAEAPDDTWLRLSDEDARAIYEALADYFGHTGHDTRALRKDYDAERARVDKLINHAIGGRP